MLYGITGNPHKERLWDPVAELVAWLLRQEIPFCLDTFIAKGLEERELVAASVCREHTSSDLSEEADMVLSFGGDGTLLRTAHDLGEGGTPILGINIGKLGFLADIEVSSLKTAIQKLEAGDYEVEARMALETATASDDTSIAEKLPSHWALNEFVLARSDATGLIHINVKVDGTHLNRYWADGLIIGTPTGSTGYSLSVGGPIVMPGTDAIILTPIAPHTLTIRPIVLPGSAVIEATVPSDGKPYVLSTDGRSTVFEEHEITFTIRRADHSVNLVKLTDRHYFETLRSKLMWGA